MSKAINWAQILFFCSLCSFWERVATATNKNKISILVGWSIFVQYLISHSVFMFDMYSLATLNFTCTIVSFTFISIPSRTIVMYILCVTQ